MDLLQLAYQRGIGVGDAVIFLLQRMLSHLEKLEKPCSAFNTIQPTLLTNKLELMGVDRHFTSWILDYLVSCPQFVRTRNCMSDMVVCCTGTHLKIVLAPYLFALYTADLKYNSPHWYL